MTTAPDSMQWSLFDVAVLRKSILAGSFSLLTTTRQDQESSR